MTFSLTVQAIHHAGERPAFRYSRYVRDETCHALVDGRIRRRCRPFRCVYTVIFTEKKQNTQLLTEKTSCFLQPLNGTQRENMKISIH